MFILQKSVGVKPGRMLNDRDVDDYAFGSDQY